MNEELKKIIKQLEDHYSNWNDDFKKRQGISPYVQRDLDHVIWMKNVIEECPENIEGKEAEDFQRRITAQLLQAKEVLPIGVSFIAESTLSTFTANTASNMAAHSFIDASVKINTKCSPWANSKREEYVLIQKKLGKESEVKALIEKLDKDLFEKIKLVEIHMGSQLEGISFSTTAANSMRNVLIEYRNFLVKKAREKANLFHRQELKWEEIINILSLFQKNSYEHKTLLNQGDILDDLKGPKLSNLTKDYNQKTVNPSDIKRIHSEFIDHLFTVLDLLFNEKYKLD